LKKVATRWPQILLPCQKLAVKVERGSLYRVAETAKIKVNVKSKVVPLQNFNKIRMFHISALNASDASQSVKIEFWGDFKPRTHVLARLRIPKKNSLFNPAGRG